VLVICELLGAPYQDRADFRRRSTRATDLSLPPHERTAAFRELRAYMIELAVRAQTCPGQGMLSALHREHGHELTTHELAGIGHLMVFAGHMVLVSLPAANRDPTLTPDPDVLDITRGPTGHLAFGHGAHHCLGAPLARAEMRIAFPALLRRSPNLRLADEHAQVELRTFGILHGITHLPVTW
jgi:cytochrome P450